MIVVYPSANCLCLMSDHVKPSDQLVEALPWARSKIEQGCPCRYAPFVLQRFKALTQGEEEVCDRICRDSIDVGTKIYSRI